MEDTKSMLKRSLIYAGFFLIVFAIMAYPFDSRGIETMLFYMFAISLFMMLITGVLTLLLTEDTSEYGGSSISGSFMGIQSPDMVMQNYAERENEAIKHRKAGEIKMPERLSSLFLAWLWLLLISIAGFIIT